MDRDKDRSFRRLSGSNQQAQPFRRTRSVRASLRLIGARWKPPAKQEPPYKFSTPSKDIIAQFERLNNNEQHSEVIVKSEQEAGDGNLKIRNNLKLLQAFAKENVRTDSVPLNVAPKAAAILQIPTAVASQSSRLVNGKEVNHLIFNGGMIPVLKRSTSLKDEEQTLPKTATIRRGSVWANSSSSKNNIFCV